MFKSAILVATILFPIFSFAETTWLGDRRALVLPLLWSDLESTVTKQDLDGAFFGKGTMSLREYFLENSQGKFNLTGAILDFKKTSVKYDMNIGCNPDAIAKIALDLFKNDFKVSDYDSDKDGKVDHLYVVHSGRIPHDRVGPDCMFTNGFANETAVFQSQGVGSKGSQIPIGFYIHEAGHELYSFPDLYGDHYNGRYGIGMWGMMGLGAWGQNNNIQENELFRLPSHFEPLSKVRIGWVQPRVIKTSTTNVKLRPVETSGDIVSIPLSRGASFYLEYRSKRGFSADLNGHGLLIWKDFKIIQADGRDDINNGNRLGRRPLPPIAENFGDDSDPFPGSMNVTFYEDASAGVRIENIVLTDEEVTFDVVKTTVAPQPLHENEFNWQLKYDGTNW